MKVVCLVPSLTETLLECGVHVVGRTRYCIHPADQIKGIPAVGGTKDLNKEKLKQLDPNLLILDKEENNKWMKDNAPCEVFVSHVDSLVSLSETFKSLSEVLDNSKLLDLHFRCEKIIQTPSKKWLWSKVPGQKLSWMNGSLTTPLQDSTVRASLDTDSKSNMGSSSKLDTKLRYIIWRNPWMSIAPQTFIGDVIKKLGGEQFLVSSENNYPKLEDSDLKDPNVICLFSSEPYPFEKHKEHLPEWAPHGALIDGELYSWFGIRSLRFLEKELGI